MVLLWCLDVEMPRFWAVAFLCVVLVCSGSVCAGVMSEDQGAVFKIGDPVQGNANVFGG